jgi:hypothetical protein
MGNPRLIVTSPLLRTKTVAKVAGEPGRPLSIYERQVEFCPEPLSVALRAKEAGAEVTYLGLSEPCLLEAARSELERHGIVTEIIEAEAAALETIEYVGQDGGSLLEVVDHRLPAISDVDLLLDRLGVLLERGPACVVAASDLEGAETLDFVERVIGRAFGMGARTITAVSGASLKQAFHARPLAAFCEERELIRISPSRQGAPETTAETLRRIFEDSTRLLLVLGNDGIVRAAAREGTVELGPLFDLRSTELMGAVAARLVQTGEEYLAAAREAYALMRQASGTGAVRREAKLETPMGELRESRS